MIRYGDIEYFTLLELNDKLKYRSYDRLDLLYLDRLRNEVESKINEINSEYKKQCKDNLIKKEE